MARSARGGVVRQRVGQGCHYRFLLSSWDLGFYVVGSDSHTDPTVSAAIVSNWTQQSRLGAQFRDWPHMPERPNLGLHCQPDSKCWQWDGPVVTALPGGPTSAESLWGGVKDSCFGSNSWQGEDPSGNMGLALAPLTCSPVIPELVAFMVSRGKLPFLWHDSSNLFQMSPPGQGDSCSRNAFLSFKGSTATLETCLRPDLSPACP